MSKCQMQISTSPQNKKKMSAMILMNIFLNKLNALKLLLKRIAIGISVAHMRSVLLVSFE